MIMFVNIVYSYSYSKTAGLIKLKLLVTIIDGPTKFPWEFQIERSSRFREIAEKLKTISTFYECSAKHKICGLTRLSRAVFPANLQSAPYLLAKIKLKLIVVPGAISISGFAVLTRFHFLTFDIVSWYKEFKFISVSSCDLIYCKKCSDD